VRGGTAYGYAHSSSGKRIYTGHQIFLARVKIHGVGRRLQCPSSDDVGAIGTCISVSIPLSRLSDLIAWDDAGLKRRLSNSIASKPVCVLENQTLEAR